MSSEVFEYKEDELGLLFQSLSRKSKEELPRLQGEARKRLCRELEQGLSEVNNLIGQLDAEMRKAPTPYRSELMNKVRQHRKTAETLARDVRNSTENVGGTTVLGGFGDEFQQGEASQRASLLGGGQSISRASESIARSHAVALETDAIGADIIDELGTQREQLVNTRTRLTETNENLSRSRKILRTMGRRMMTNKLIVIVIIVLEALILAGVVYWKFFT